MTSICNFRKFQFQLDKNVSESFPYSRSQFICDRLWNGSQDIDDCCWQWRVIYRLFFYNQLHNQVLSQLIVIFFLLYLAINTRGSAKLNILCLGTGDMENCINAYKNLTIRFRYWVRRSKKLRYTDTQVLRYMLVPVQIYIVVRLSVYTTSTHRTLVF